VLLSAAARAFDELGMLPLLAAARRFGRAAGVTLPAGSDVAPPALRVILATDIIGSTALNQRLGDVRFVDVLREHNRIIRTRLREHDGVEVKHTGDGMCAWFASAANAVLCALRIFDDFAEYSRRNPGEEMAIRVGLAAGEPIGLEGDLFGLSVVTAFRVCALGDGTGVLTAPEIPGLAGETGLRFEPLGEFTLKGIAEPVTVYAARTAA
jgi:class 3 adenylate cyclase